MTNEQHAAVLGYLELVRDRLYLQGYAVTLRRDEPDDKDALAMVSPTDGRYWMTIRLGTGFFGTDAETQRNTLVHEMLHVLQRDMTDTIRIGGLLKQLGQPSYDILWGAFSDADEKLTDRLALIVAPLLPLPDFPGDGQAQPEAVAIEGSDPTTPQAEFAPADTR